MTAHEGVERKTQVDASKNPDTWNSRSLASWLIKEPSTLPLPTTTPPHKQPSARCSS